MNTLGYVARQFDVLASTRPTTTADSDATSVHRVNSENWSSQSFLFPQSLKPRRSQSTPTIHKPSHQSTSSPLSPPASSTTRPTTTEHVSPPPRSKENLESVISRIFFIRVFLVVWDNLKVAWSSLAEGIDALHALSWRRAMGALQAAGPASPSAKGKGRAADQDTLELVEEPAASATSISIRARHGHESSHSSGAATSVNSRSGTPVLNAKKSPFHLPKTLVLDLDETLIHSTSRPLNSQQSSSWLGLMGEGRRNKGAGHVIEVVLGGRSTLYHVYKRPFVDFFLRTVRLNFVSCHLYPLERVILGFWMVHSRNIHGFHARIRRPSD